MHSGRIWVADHQGVFVIRMEGDVRLTLCISFDDFISDMFARSDLCSAVFDLSEAVGIDSTTLGLMAKIAILSSQESLPKPLVVAPSPGIQRLLLSMGFDEIFNIVDQFELSQSEAFVPLEEDAADEHLARQKILEAHKTLMSLNDKNRETFMDLIKSLEHS